MSDSGDIATAVRLHPDDNVLCLLRDHRAGEIPQLPASDCAAPLPSLLQATPLGHKIALTEIVEGEPVLKYGVPIALARQRIQPGEHAHLHNLADLQDTATRLSPAHAKQDPQATEPCSPAPIAASPDNTDGPYRLPSEFAGFQRSSGRPGIRNHLLILSVCGLNAAGARKVRAALPGSLLVSTAFGRGQLGADREFHDRMLRQLACHPNVGGVILLAADRHMRQRYQSVITEQGRLCAGFSLQECGEDTVHLTELASVIGNEMQQQLASVRRQPCKTDTLAVAMECGHSDASSGMVSNPLCGRLADELVHAGGTVVISETVEWSGAEQDLYQRCQTRRIAERLQKLVIDRHEIARAAGRDLTLGNPGPQNHDGGITTLVEKSRGAIAKAGTTGIIAALAQGELLPASAGLCLMDTPALSPESISSMVASGAQLVLFTTGPGNPYGSAIAPTIKLSANPQTTRRVGHQIDFDASAAFDGRPSAGNLLPPLGALLLRVCEGESVAAERLDEGDEVISRLSASV
ncbi:UxaA family hydrolase [Granulosicoccus sp. 3-233]|uniref:UxaA family hydrolase n=1 Tax=Granulosicoccus sp. 3-233 TaxID=3417969 RepID=UPI003D33C305